MKNFEDALKTEFSWDEIGDIAEGRRNLGPEMPVAVYRLFQYTLERVLSGSFGAEKGTYLFRNAGFVAGRTFATQFLSKEATFDEFVSDLKNKLKEFKIGVLRLEKVDLEKMEITLSIAEDLDCSGLPILGDSICTYDEGFIAGMMYFYTGQIFSVKEIDCWATGGRTCRFEIKGE